MLEFMKRYCRSEERGHFKNQRKGIFSSFMMRNIRICLTCFFKEIRKNPAFMKPKQVVVKRVI